MCVTAYYRATELLDERTLAADAALLDAQERARRDRFKFARDRRDFVAAHALLRRTLSTYRDVPASTWRFDTGPFGKPAIQGSAAGAPPLTFNLSHTHGLVACAVADSVEIGVDVEAIDRRGTDVSRIAHRYFGDGEVIDLLAQPAEDQRRRFFELWVLKEAYIKAIGKGLAHPLQSFAFDFVGGDALRFTAPPDEDATRWHFALFAVRERYRLGIAVRAHDDQWAPAFEAVDATRAERTAVLLRRSATAASARSPRGYSRRDP